MQSMNNPYTAEQQDTLLEVAALSIQHGLEHGTPLAVDAAEYDPVLQEIRASFVTLQIEQELRGCIGMLQAVKPLVEDVAHNAFSAAFKDPRFNPLRPAEFPLLDIHISVLTPPEPFPVSSEAELLRKLSPGEDGLILRDGPYQSTFLPSVWESLPRPQDFLHHLKLKAGLRPDYWSDTIQFERYQTISFGKKVSEIVELEKT